MRWLPLFLLLFVPLFSNMEDDDRLYLSLNVEQGAKLELSDGSTYEIDPEDRLYTEYWITPFPIMLSGSGNENYPVKITNMNTGRSVKGKQISTEKMLQEDKQRRVQKEMEILKKPPAEPKTKEKSAPKKSDPTPKPIPKQQSSLFFPTYNQEHINR